MKSHKDYVVELIDAADEGTLDKDDMLRNALNYMNTEEIKEFIELNGYEDVVEVD